MSDDRDSDCVVDITEAGVAGSPPLKSTPRNKVTDANAGIVLTGFETPPSEFRSIPATRSELLFRHNSWRGRRQQVWDSLLRLHRSNATLMRFAECGAALQAAVRDDKREVKMMCDKCRNRCCVACGVERSAIIAENLAQFMETADARFMTLTLRHSHTTLADQITRLYDCFSNLRRREWWKAHVVGGAAFCEVKLSDKTGLWHVHLHLIVHGSFASQKELSREWLAVTGDSSIVDIRAISDHLHVARYVTKYVTKPIDTSIFGNPDKLDEAISSLHGRRLCLTFGSWRGKTLCDPPDDGHTWTKIGSFERLWSRMKDGDAEATALITHLTLVLPRCVPFFEAKFGINSG